MKKPTENQFEITRTPCGNYAIATPRGYLATRHGDYWRERETAPVSPAIYHSQAICRETLADYSRFLVDLAKRRENQAREHKAHFAARFGESHRWPEKGHARIAELRTLAIEAREKSRAAWLASGRNLANWEGMAR